MVLDLELRQPTLGHFNTWSYGTKGQAENGGAETSRFARHSLTSPFLLHKRSSARSISQPLVLPHEALDRDLYAPASAQAPKTVSEQSSRITGSYNGSAGLRIPSPQSGVTSIMTITNDTDDHQKLSEDGILASTSGQFVAALSSVPNEPSSLSRKRRRAIHDVDGPGTSHLSSKKRRLRLQLITSRLSQPFSLPATHILNRESDEGTPVISRFVKLAAIGAKKAGHQTALVRKAAILNRVRLNVRQAALTKGHDRLWRMTGMGAMSHGFQLVTDSTGAMFPGRSGEQVPGPIVPRAWRPHTTGPNGTTDLELLSRSHLISKRTASGTTITSTDATSSESRAVLQNVPPTTSIMTPFPGADEDEASFPDTDLDSKYTDLSDDDTDDVYADFSVLFGGVAGSTEDPEEDDHFYEEYLDEVDGIMWAS